MVNELHYTPAPPSRILGLTPAELEIVKDLLHRHVPNRPVWAFGSRAFGRARRRSDLDLAIGGSAPLLRSIRLNLADAFDESDLPIEVDLVDLNEVTTDFRSRIEPDFFALHVEATQPPAGRSEQVEI